MMSPEFGILELSSEISLKWPFLPLKIASKANICNEYSINLFIMNKMPKPNYL